jgi:hypothetical protein
MKYTMIVGALALATTAALARPTASQGSTQQLEGEWQGRSLCVTTRRPACTDETVVYRIKRHAPGIEAFDIAAFKLVDGKEEFMGDLACNFEATRQQLICPQGQGAWQFRWDGRQLLGVLYDADGPFRVISVDKARP